MLNRVQNEWRTAIIFFIMIAMLLSLFVSRAALSASIGVFFVASFQYQNPGKQFRLFISSQLLWGLSLLFFLPFFSGLWSNDKQEWLEIVKIKLPFLLLPFAFAAPFQLQKQQWDWLAYFFLLLVFSGTIWSMVVYLQNAGAFNAGYLQAISIDTPLENDRIRFSLLVSLAALLSVRMALQKKKPVSIWVLFGVWFVVFLHILSVRTGLLTFYIMLFAAGVYLLLNKLNRAKGLLLLTLVILLPFAAYYSLPSFQNRVKFFVYEYDFFKHAAYIPASNDAVRVASWKTGSILLKKNITAGVGFGDIVNEMSSTYNSVYPGIKETDKILPASEWLLYGLGCGIAGMITFTFVMLIPFFIKTRDSFLWKLCAVAFAFSFIADIGLEVQFGVFIYLFITLWWWKWLTAKNI